MEIKRRNCTHLKSMDVINDLAAIVGPEQKVNLTTPKTVILVEVFRVRVFVFFACVWSKHAV